MATENDRRLQYQTTDDFASLNNTQIGVQNGNDTDLGFRMWGGKDGAATITRWLSKDQLARTKDLTIIDTTGEAKIIHGGDTDTYISMVADRMRLFAGAVSMIDMVEDAQDYVEFNSAEGDVDFIWNALSISNAMAIHGSTGKVGFGTAEPTHDIHVSKSVDGIVNIQANNANTGTSANANVGVQTDAGLIALSAFSGAYTATASGLAGAGLTTLRSTNTGGMLIANESDTDLSFATNDTVRMVIDNDGKALLTNDVAHGSTTDYLTLSNTNATEESCLLTGLGIVAKLNYGATSVQLGKIAFVATNTWSAGHGRDSAVVLWCKEDDHDVPALSIDGEEGFVMRHDTTNWTEDQRIAWGLGDPINPEKSVVNISPSGTTWSVYGTPQITVVNIRTAHSYAGIFNGTYYDTGDETVVIPDAKILYKWQNNGADKLTVYCNGATEQSYAPLAHGMTDYLTTAAYSKIAPMHDANPAYGGLKIIGASGATGPGLKLMGIGQSSCTIHSYIDMVAGKKDGAGIQDVGADDFVLRVLNRNTVALSVYGDGDTVVGGGLKVAALAGVGTRAVVVDENGVMSAP